MEIVGDEPLEIGVVNFSRGLSKRSERGAILFHYRPLQRGICILTAKFSGIFSSTKVNSFSEM